VVNKVNEHVLQYCHQPLVVCLLHICGYQQLVKFLLNLMGKFFELNENGNKIKEVFKRKAA